VIRIKAGQSIERVEGADMDRISRFFGKKPDHTAASGEEHTPAPVVPEYAAPTRQSGEHGMTETIYGLNFLSESGENRVFANLPISIGRGEQNDLILADESVSTVHVRVYYDEIVDDVCIVDLDSLNGLYIDDKPTRKNVLQDGVKIRLGQVQMTFRDTGYIHPV
jgi:hypothetical protein